MRAQAFSTIREFAFDAAGQRASMWNGSVPGQGIQGQYVWGGGPLAYYKPGAGAHYQHQDWLGTERMRTSYGGAVEDSYASLPFGDAQTTGADNDPFHFAGLDYDSEANVDHAEFREYSPTQGRWFESDPSDGSYVFDNPQSLNRYSYVLDNPLSMSDPAGLGDNGGGCGLICLLDDIGQAIANLFSGGGPSFHGSLHPRPTVGGPSWDGNFGESLGISTKLPQMNLGIADALGLPNAGCDFGACGSSGDDFLNGHRHNTHGCNFIFGNCYDPTAALFAKLASLIHISYADSSDPNHRLFGTHYCGPGGGGSPTNGLDMLCAAHDACYRAHGVSAIDNFNPFTTGSGMGECDKLLCLELDSYHPNSHLEAVGRNEVRQIFNCSYINK